MKLEMPSGRRHTPVIRAISLILVATWVPYYGLHCSHCVPFSDCLSMRQAVEVHGSELGSVGSLRCHKRTDTAALPGVFPNDDCCGTPRPHAAIASSVSPAATVAPLLVAIESPLGSRAFRAHAASGNAQDDSAPLYLSFKSLRI